MLISPVRRVPHPCVVCKGGYHEAIPLRILGIEVRAAHPFAQNAKGWGTHNRGAVRKAKAKGWATRPESFPVCPPTCSDHRHPGRYSPRPIITDSRTTASRLLPSRNVHLLSARSMLFARGFMYSLYLRNSEPRGILSAMAMFQQPSHIPYSQSSSACECLLISEPYLASVLLPALDEPPCGYEEVGGDVDSECDAHSIVNNG